MKKPNKRALSARLLVAKLTLLSGSLLGLMALSQPVAEAYYYPFYGRGFTNLLYPLRYAAYPLMGLTGPYSAFTPYTPYRILTTGRLTGYPYMYGPQMLKNYTNDEPLNSPRKRVKQQRLGQEFGVDQSTNAQWADDETDARLATSAPPAAPPGYAQQPSPGAFAGNAPGALGVNGYPATNAAGVSNAYLAHQGIGQFNTPQAGFNSSGHALPNPDGTPPMAPQVASKNPVSLAPNMNDAASATNKGAVRAPLADGFINLVNTKFQGNVKTALFDPETRGWAKMLGMVSDDSMFGTDFSDTRVELIRQIFADQSLDSVSKLSAVKILLNNTGANRAK
jgi:hypothetical protein